MTFCFFNHNAVVFSMMFVVVSPVSRYFFLVVHFFLHIIVFKMTIIKK